MTKKHFKLLAEAISKLKSEKEREKVAQLVGEVCRQINPRFDWTRWRTACNVKGLYA